MPNGGSGNGDDDGAEMLVFGTGERIASTDRVFSGEAGALLLKWKREADAAAAKAAREAERKLAEAQVAEAELELKALEQRGGRLQ